MESMERINDSLMQMTPMLPSSDDFDFKQSIMKSRIDEKEKLNIRE